MGRGAAGVAACHIGLRGAESLGALAQGGDFIRGQRVTPAGVRRRGGANVVADAQGGSGARFVGARPRRGGGRSQVDDVVIGGDSKGRNRRWSDCRTARP
jgi:hypothetical protein